MALSNFLKNIAIGQMRHRVGIERAMVSDDGAGGGVRIWQPFAQIWARIEPAAMAYDNANSQAAQTVTHRVVMRWRNDIDSSCRIIGNGRIYQIHAVADGDERRRFLVALCEEKIP